MYSGNAVCLNRTVRFSTGLQDKQNAQFLCESLWNYITKQSFGCTFWNYDENIYRKHHKWMSICNCFALKLSVKHNIRNVLMQMSAGIKVSFLVVATGEVILGMLGNGFIGLVNCMEWVKTGKVSSADFILTSLAMARIIQLWVMLLDAFIKGLYPHLYASSKVLRMFSILWALTDHLSTWFATCLSIFYFLKIANFSHCFFMWLKWRVNKVVLVLFLGSFFSLSVNLLMQDILTDFRINTSIERNMTLQLDINTIFYLKSVLLLTLIYVIPFFLSLISLLLLFLSLVRHTKNLQLSLTGSRDSSTEAHRRAMAMVTTFLFLFITYTVSVLTASWIFIKVQTHQAMMPFIVISPIFPSGHSFIIILGNSKLRQIALRLLRKAKPVTLKTEF